MHHLKMIGGLILMRQAEGNLKRVPGAGSSSRPWSR